MDVYILTRMVRSISAISVYAACMADKYAAEGLAGAYSSNHIRIVKGEDSENVCCKEGEWHRPKSGCKVEVDSKAYLMALRFSEQCSRYTSNIYMYIYINIHTHIHYNISI